MANTQTRTFGASFSGAINSISGYTTMGRLHIAVTPLIDPDYTLANVQWCRGPLENLGGGIIAYLDLNGESSGSPDAVKQTTFGDQGTDGTPGPGDVDGNVNAYVSFKRVFTNEQFTAGIADIASKNGLESTADSGDVAGAVLWADANLNYWTNFNAVSTTTTQAPSFTYFYIDNCDGSYAGSEKILKVLDPHNLVGGETIATNAAAENNGDWAAEPRAVLVDLHPDQNQTNYDVYVTNVIPENCPVNPG